VSSVTKMNVVVFMTLTFSYKVGRHENRLP
jgi:hypothetical protein